MAEGGSNIPVLAYLPKSKFLSVGWSKPKHEELLCCQLSPNWALVLLVHVFSYAATGGLGGNLASHRCPMNDEVASKGRVPFSHPRILGPVQFFYGYLKNLGLVAL